MKQPLIGRMREISALMRTIAASVLVTFAMLILQPAAMAARAEIAEQKRQAALEAGEEAKLSQAVRKIERQLDRVGRKLEKGQATGVDEQALEALRQEVTTLANAVSRNFEEVEAHIRDHKLDPIIMQRHEAAVAQFEQELSAMLRNLDAVRGAADPREKRALVQKARKHLSGQKLQRAQQPFDPNDLPFQSLKPNPENKPKRDKKDFSAAGLYDNPAVQLAAVGDFIFDKLPGASNPDYLGETTEVRLSDAVKAKAAELGHDPVRIFRWVRNNVEWQPTWGAMQDADLTLGAQRGNAFDIASLTIALLRASGVPARHVHGTIEVSEDKFRNWAGGFESTSAAADYASSGGIPAAAVLEGGRIAKIQMEHVWVEAAIDYHPSRGAVNRDADSWVQMDPSFKQYEYLEGLDPIAISGLGPEALAQEFLESGTVNEAEGWATGFDPTILQTAQAQAQQSMEDYIADNMTDPTVGDVIGGRKTIIAEHPNLPSSLPNHILVTGTRYAHLPAALQHRMGFAFGTDVLGEPIGLVSYPMAEINNRKVTLSFRPATPADGEALKSLLPEGEITDISQLPSSIPSYLVNVVPELKVDGVVKSSGGPMPLGEDLPFMFYVTLQGHGTTPYQYKVPAGAYLSIAGIGGNVSPTALQNLQARVEATAAKLESGDASLRGTLGREDVLGDMFYAGTLGYFGQYLAMSHMLGLQQGAYQSLFAGYGSYGYEPNVSYLFSFPRSIEPGGVVMNVRLTTATGTSIGDRERYRDFSFQTGLLSSALEHAVPERMLVTSENPGEAISAVKALAKANSAGQRIYHITSENQTETLPNIIHNADTMSEISAALASGKDVVTHAAAVDMPAWSGAGYIIFDRETGDGAYKISGGKNGSELGEVSNAFTFAGLAAEFQETLVEVFNVRDHGAAKAVARSISIFSIIISSLYLASVCPEDAARVLIALQTVFTLITMVPGLLVGVIFSPFGALFLGVLLVIGFSLAMSYLVSNVCRPRRS